ncbi:WD and tetratricopeptide repeats protein 1-like [Euwallacea fornicatus]|uniref:WD and tetratricopeptide repeats protein 1-like n=1 Tax=Euwallacea fornicatus TaxID=995702 RepID=UPI00338E7317
MEEKIRKSNVRKNIVNLLQHREIRTEGSKYVKRHCQFTDELVKRLGFEYELQGHQGCVNCLQWTPDGRLLASGSDDTQVMIWDPMKHKRVHALSTNHFGNIFSVKFLGTNNSIIATAAGDCKVYVQTIEGEQLLDCSCHKNRVKRLASSPLDPTVFWSAGEDGRVMQYDLREPHDCGSRTANLLVAYRTFTEIKCIAVNPTKPHYLAVGVNDAFVRIYDRRKLKTYPLSQTTDNKFVHPSKTKLKEPKCAQYYAPGHLALDNLNTSSSRYVVTYIAFNSSGSEMLVNMGGEQIYLFDVNRERQINEIRFSKLMDSRRKLGVYKCKCNLDDHTSSYVPDNYDLKKSKKIPTELCPCFYMRRAFHLYRRKWVGDLYGAARDYLFVIERWPNQTKAFVGLIKCLIALEWANEAKSWYEHFCQIVPEFTSQNQAKKLRSAIKTLEEKPREKPSSNSDLMELTKIETEEIQKRLGARDYDLRFVGHCNTTTDIMEANFLGEDGNFICAGSDEGIIFLWERKTQSIVNALVGDVSIVNCLQPHPSTCLIASSGIDSVVKLWSPMPEDGTENIRVVKNIEPVVRANQQRMVMDPFETLLINMGYQMDATFLNMERPFEDFEGSQCNPS